MINSWYSHESVSNTISATSGAGDLRIDSELPAQSWNSSHTSTGFFVCMSASATSVAYRVGNASAAVMTLQN